MEGIKINRFRITPCPTTKWMFDVYETVNRINKETEKPYSSEKNIAYGVTLQKAVKIIAAEESIRVDGELMELSEYVDKHFERVETITSALISIGKSLAVKLREDG